MYNGFIENQAYCYKHGPDELFELTALFILPVRSDLFWLFYVMLHSSIVQTKIPVFLEVILLLI